MKGEVADTNAFQVGSAYSRAEVASAAGVAPPVGPRDPYWSSGIVRFDNAVMLFVTLEKENYSYRDQFEGSLFWWQSQTQQTLRSEVLIAMAERSLEAHLFARVRATIKGATQKFYYCGRLSAPLLEGEKPVTALFDALDFHPDGPEGLREIYRWRSPHGQLVRDEKARRNSLASARANRKGRQLDPVLRKAIELHAMRHATQHYTSLGYTVEDTSATQPYDLVCTRGREQRRVEVKGTQTTGSVVNLTHGEVRAARESSVVTDLHILYSIALAAVDSGNRVPTGGQCHRIEGWVPLDKDLTPVEYAYAVPDSQEEFP